MKYSFANPIVQVDIQTGRVHTCRIQEIWDQMVCTTMTAEDYSFWLKRETARRQVEVTVRTETPSSQSVSKKTTRNKRDIILPDVLEYLLAELAHGARPMDLARKTGIAKETIYKIRSERPRYRQHLQVYRLHDQGLDMEEIITQTGLSSGTVRQLIQKYKSILTRADENELAS